MKTKVYRGKLSFSAVERGVFQLGSVGIQMGKPVLEDTAKQKMLESFGIFGSNSNNNNFYPEVKNAQDVIPKPEDYVDVPFRLLSATIVGAGSWKATDFSDIGVLKNSRSKLDGKGVYKNHDLEIDNWVGVVKATSWSEGFTNNTGEKVPPGIDGILALDAKSEPKVVRGVLSGAVYSNSVTVEFDWEPSHTFENEYDFLNKVGTYASDGTMIRRIVKAIHNYHETSLVFLGADPFSKLIDKEGNLKNIDGSSIEYNKADKAGEAELNSYKEDGRLKLNLSLDKNIISLSKQKLSEEIKDEPMNKEILLALAKILGLADTEVTEANFLAQLSKIPAVDPKMASYKAKSELFDTMVGKLSIVAEDGEPVKVTLIEEGAEVKLSAVLADDTIALSAEKLKELKDSVTSLEADAKVGKDYLQLQRDEVVRLYKLSAGEGVDDAVVSLMQSAGSEALPGLLKMHTKGVGMKFSGACKSCGSSEFEFRSSVGGQDEPITKGEEAPAEVKSKSFTQLHNEMTYSPMSVRKNG